MSIYNDGFSFAESSDSFIIDIDRTSDEYKIWQGLVGAHYTPYVDAEGNLSWTNNGDLPNPPTQNIRGEPGTGLTIKGIVATVGDLPQSANDGDTYLVGTDAPYEGYLYTNNQWVDIGEIGVGQPGRGIVSITKTSSTGTNPVIDTYTITYTDSTTSTFLVTNGVKGDTGTAAGFGTPTATIDANTGTPSVTVTASGSSTAKVFAFAFHNLKGAKGEAGQGVPTGGTTGQVLKKTSSTDYATEWGAVEAVPTGGTTGQVLAKKTNTDYDIEWINPPAGVEPSTSTPADLGTAAVGTSDKFARGDHVHNYPTIVHVGDSAPSDSNIEVWLDTDEQGASVVTSVNGQSGAVTIPDYVVEQGTSGIWTYRKWNSGVAECWGKNQTSQSFSAWGSLYSTDVPSQAYPSGLFISNPCHFAQTHSVSDTANTISSIGASGSATETPPIIAIRGTTASALTAESYYYAIGRWKA